MQKTFIGLGAILAMLTLAGCQTPRESAIDAAITCESQGFRPGTKAYRQCQSANYIENRRASNEAGNAVAAGVAAGVIGGAIVGAAVSDRRYYRGYGYSRVIIVPVPDYRRYDLYAPRNGYRWVRDDGGHYLLVSIASGIISDILYRNGL